MMDLKRRKKKVKIMATYSLVPYRLRVKRKNTDNYYDLSELPIDKSGNTKDIINILEDFTEKYTKTIKKFDDREKTMTIENLNKTKTGRGLHGIIKSGEFGIEADFYNIENNTRRDTAREVSDSEEIPLFFFLYYPKGRKPKRAYFIMQKFKNIGGKVIFESALKDHIEKINNKLYLEIKPIIHPDVLDKLERADRIKSLRFIRHRKPQSTDDLYYYESDEEEKVKEEREIKFGRKNGKVSEWIKENLMTSLKNKDDEYLEIDEEEYETLKVTVEEKNSQSTLTVGDDMKVREKRPISSAEIETEGGHPVQESIFELAKEYLELVLNKDEERLPED